MYLPTLLILTCCDSECGTQNDKERVKSNFEAKLAIVDRRYAQLISDSHMLL